jgi:hypothetical protein
MVGWQASNLGVRGQSAAMEQSASTTVQVRRHGGCEMSPLKLGGRVVGTHEARRWCGVCSGMYRPNESECERAWVAPGSTTIVESR